MLRVFQTNVAGKFADGLVPGVPLSERQGLTGPVDDGCCADELLLTLGGERREAAQQVMRVAHGKPRGAAYGEIVRDSGNHEFAPGHG